MEEKEWRLAMLRGQRELSKASDFRGKMEKAKWGRENTRKGGARITLRLQFQVLNCVRCVEEDREPNDEQKQNPSRLVGCGVEFGLYFVYQEMGDRERS